MNIRDFKLFKSEMNSGIKNVIVRADLNLPSEVEDLSRIFAIKETIDELLALDLNVILIAHYKRPSEAEAFTEKFSLSKIKDKVSEVIREKVDFIDTDIYQLSRSDIKSKLTLLENLRFYKGEEQNDLEFAKKIASLGDAYINEAFSVSHRAHASVNAITKFLPSFAGIAFSKEIEFLNKVTTDIKRPYTAIIGGSKVSSKMEVLKKISGVADNLIIAGAMANTFLIALGYSLGTSLFEENYLEVARDIYKNSVAKIILPCDFMCSDDINKDGVLFGINIGNSTGTAARNNTIEKNNVKLEKPIQEPNFDNFGIGFSSIDQNWAQGIEQQSVPNFPENYSCFDIGEKSIACIKEVIYNSRTVLWNGALGAFEFANFDISSNEIARLIAEMTRRSQDNTFEITSLVGSPEPISSTFIWNCAEGMLDGIFDFAHLEGTQNETTPLMTETTNRVNPFEFTSLIGGGETVASIKNYKKDMSFVSTAGGAFLEYIAGYDLPGVTALRV